ncbi:MAG TPA: DUF4097 family beta strand repeat-containing protein [Gemmatimonadaceae bacterium]|nr:DUF4097 family beta strand repeat-containing protein [Gemmatimonadaceae bacterium]
MTLAAALVALVAAPAVLDAQERMRQREQNAFQWSGQIPEGAWLRLRNINGRINVLAASGANAEVTADKTWRRGSPEQVRVEMIRDGDNVTICAIWHENVRCDADGYQGRGRSNDSNDVAVEFTVRLPRNVHVQLNTVNGGVAVEGATGQVRAQTVNGGVRVASSAGPVDARTTNGSIEARMGAATLASDVSFRTVNGSITLTLPANFNAELETRTVNGSVQTDFPITMSGRINPRQLRGTLGSGGRRLELHTVNGSIRINRS